MNKQTHSSVFMFNGTLYNNLHVTHAYHTYQKLQSTTIITTVVESHFIMITFRTLMNDRNTDTQD